MILGKKVAIFDWEWGRNSALEMGRKSRVEDVYTYPANVFVLNMLSVYHVCGIYMNAMTMKATSLMMFPFVSINWLPCHIDWN